MPAPVLPSRSTRAIGLIVALMAAKALSVAGRDLPASIWLLPATFWHDVAVGAVFWAVDVLLRRPRLMWLPYALIVVYAAINVPIARVLSSPLTVPMWRAARGPLLDSITTYLTPINLALILTVLVLGVAAPTLATRWPALVRRGFVVVAAVLIVTGPVAVRRIDSPGFQRNAITALVATALPRLAARPGAEDWRTSPFGERAGEDLTRFRGAMANRNVVIVILESTAARYLASYGAKDDATPHLTALARRSILFEHAYAVYPESIKGLFALLCSRSPAFDVPVEAHVSAPCEALPRLLGARGYQTGLFHSGRFAYLGMSELLARQGFGTLEDAGAIGGNVKSSFGVDEPSVVRRMLSWIDDRPAGRKFLLVYAPVAGHHPYASPEVGPFGAGDELGMYKNALHYGDRSLGVFLDGLRARGLDTETLVVVFGDHGEAFGQHDGNFGHSIFIYEENIRIPLIMGSAASGEDALGTRVRRLASVIDITPTILDLLGMPAARLHEGTSLLEPRDRMALFYTDYTLGWLGLRDGCWKLLYEIESRRSRLFDVCADPGEKADRSEAEPVRVATYRDRLERWGAAQRAAITDPSRPDTPGGR
ncbi:MAG TPA: sulfatase [Vicinamibacterales bacterium]|nr:sulfatase [Vicinamibacterales bacterium]